MSRQVPFRRDSGRTTVFSQEDSAPTIQLTPATRHSAAFGIALIGFLVFTCTAAYFLINPPAIFRSNDERRPAAASPAAPALLPPAEVNDLGRHTERVQVS